MERDFQEALVARQIATNSLVCVGLDSNTREIPEDRRRWNCDDSGKVLNSFQTIVHFNRFITEATCDIASAYKLNLAFYIEHGCDGMRALEVSVRDISSIAPETPIILDGKFADIDNTNNGYASFAFDLLKVDAITVHPYLGGRALKPFSDRKNKGVFVLCKTSNDGSEEFQDQSVMTPAEMPFDLPLYQYVAHQVNNYWPENYGLVVGATYPEELEEIRKIVPGRLILAPGIGAQGGDVEQTMKAGIDSEGRGLLINSSRAIIFDKNPRGKAIELRNQTNQYR
jgi:orotidine 5'-phosphate decarboxylase subfamily 2